MDEEVQTTSLKVKILTAALAVLVVGSVGSAYYFYREYRDLRENPQKSADEEVRAIVNKVSQLIVLPQDETPTVATVTDVSQLKDQPFFANAKNGDKVLLYTTSRKAVLYRPAENRIVEVAPIVIGEPAQSSR